MKQPEYRRKHKVMANRCLLFLLVTCIMSACSKDDSVTSNQSTASVSVYALVPDAPEMNFFLNGANVAAFVPFGSFTLYNSVAAGNFILKAQTSSSNTVIDTSFSVNANLYYSLFLTDSFAKMKPVLLKDSFGTLDSGANVRFLSLAPGIPNIDFHAVKDSADFYTWKNRSFSDNITSDSINRFIKLSPGTYNFYAIKVNSTDTLAKFTSRTLSDSANYTIMLEGLYNKAAKDTSLLLGTRLHQ